MSEFHARMRHDIVVLRVKSVVPAHDVAEAESEYILALDSLHVFSHVLGMLEEFRELVGVADLRVGDDDEVVAGVVVLLLFHDEVIGLASVQLSVI